MDRKALWNLASLSEEESQTYAIYMLAITILDCIEAIENRENTGCQ